MYGKPDEQDIRKVGNALRTIADRYCLDDPDLEVGRMCLDSRPELFEEIVKLEEVR